MPLRIADGSQDPVALKDAPEEFLVFYSSIVDGKLWCPDCQAIDGLVKQVFSVGNSPSALLVYVGDRAAWKLPSNALRARPWMLTGVPTIIRLRNGMEDGRLVENEITTSSLAEFVTR